MIMVHVSYETETEKPETEKRAEACIRTILQKLLLQKLFLKVHQRAQKQFMIQAIQYGSDITGNV